MTSVLLFACSATDAAPASTPSQDAGGGETEAGGSAGAAGGAADGATDSATEAGKGGADASSDGAMMDGDGGMGGGGAGGAGGMAGGSGAGGSDGGQTESGTDSGAEAAADATPDAGADAEPEADAAHTAWLTLSLDPTIDIMGDTVKATSLTTVELLDTGGTSRANANIVAGDAIVSLVGLVPGDYFLKVNGDADDLVPTRVDDPSTDIVQRVGTMLRASVIGPVATPIYRINTYSVGQAKPAVVQCSDGTPDAPSRQPYVIITLFPPRIEFKVLGTALPLSSFAPPNALHPGNGEPFDAFLVMTNGQDHHGDLFNSDAGTDCPMCHKNMTTMPTLYGDIVPANGFCFHCHFGTVGSDNGFVDSAR